jgi:hypothetical protein
MTTKQCSQCREIKNIDQFFNRKQSPDGLTPHCKQCGISATRKWKKSNRQAVRVSGKRSYSKNKKVLLEKQKIWRKENPVRAAEIRKKWRVSNRSKCANYQLIRRTQKRENGVFLILPHELNRLYSSPCQICGTRKNITVDHVIPIRQGGRHSIGNLQPMCKPCNSSKGNKLMVEWRVRRSA